MTATPNTTSAVVAEEASGAGALAPAPEVLTIDRYKLRDLWLPAERRESESCDYLWRLYMKAKHGSVADRALNAAVTAVESEWRKTVRCIVERGGLLHIGAGV